jgi:hypothetical protein
MTLGVVPVQVDGDVRAVQRRGQRSQTAGGDDLVDTPAQARPGSELRRRHEDATVPRERRRERVKYRDHGEKLCEPAGPQDYD